MLRTAHKLWISLLITLCFYTTFQHLAYAQDETVTLTVPPSVEGRVGEEITVEINLASYNSETQEIRLRYRFSSALDVNFVSSEQCFAEGITAETRVWVIGRCPPDAGVGLPQPTNLVTATLMIAADALTDGEIRHQLDVVMFENGIEQSSRPFEESTMVRMVSDEESESSGEPSSAEPIDSTLDMSFVISQTGTIEGMPGWAKIPFQIESTSSTWEAGTKLRLYHAVGITPTISLLNPTVESMLGNTDWEFPQNSPMMLDLELQLAEGVMLNDIFNMTLVVLSADNSPYDSPFTFDSIATNLFTYAPPAPMPMPVGSPVTTPDVEEIAEITQPNNPSPPDVETEPQPLALNTVTMGVSEIDEGEQIADLTISYTSEGEWPQNGIEGRLTHPNMDVITKTMITPQTNGNTTTFRVALNTSSVSVPLQFAEATEADIDRLTVTFFDGDRQLFAPTPLSEEDRQEIKEVMENAGWFDVNPLILLLLAAIILLGLGLLAFFIARRPRPQPAVPNPHSDHVPVKLTPTVMPNHKPAPNTATVMRNHKPAPYVAATRKNARLRLQGVNRSFEISPNGSTIGRGKHNDIVIDNTIANWQSVSHEHARITRRESQYIIEDLGSSNGIFVQNRPTAKNLLKDGWTIGIGGVQFTFHQSGGKQ